MTLTPGLGRLDDGGNVLRHRLYALAENHDCDEAQAAHEMGPGEAERLPPVGQEDAQNSLGGGEDVPGDEDAAVFLFEAKRDAEIDGCAA